MQAHDVLAKKKKGNSWSYIMHSTHRWILLIKNVNETRLVIAIKHFWKRYTNTLREYKERNLQELLKTLREEEAWKFDQTPKVNRIWTWNDKAYRHWNTMVVSSGEWWWWWWVVFVEWLIKERSLFPARTTVKDSHHCKSLTCHKQHLNL